MEKEIRKTKEEIIHRITYDLEEAKMIANEKGMIAFERQALKELKKDYKGDWKKVKVKVDFDDVNNQVVFTVGDKL